MNTSPLPPRFGLIRLKAQQMVRPSHVLACLMVAALVGVLSGQAQRPGPQQPGLSSPQPARDTPAQATDPSAQAGAIGGRVIAADTGRPVKRARVLVTSGRAAWRPSDTDRRHRRVRTGRTAGRSLHRDGLEVGLRVAVLRSAPSAPGRHAAPTCRRSAVQGHRVPLAPRQRHRGPRLRRERRPDAGHHGARPSLPVSAG